ncbi:helix-turn-helix domain-containing protein [Candidatus Hodarchaeum mangrovi]
MEDPIKDYITELKKSHSVQEFEVTFSSPLLYWTRTIHKLDYPSIYETVLESGCMTVLPIIIKNGIQRHNIICPNRLAIQNLLKILKERFSQVKMIMVSSKPIKTFSKVLTPKQFEAIKLAYQSGYYDVPRRVMITDIAPKLGIKRVALQERLRRAELKILDHYFTESF